MEYNKNPNRVQIEENMNQISCWRNARFLVEAPEMFEKVLKQVELLEI